MVGSPGDGLTDTTRNDKASADPEAEASGFGSGQPRFVRATGVCSTQIVSRASLATTIFVAQTPALFQTDTVFRRETPKRRDSITNRTAIYLLNAPHIENY